MIELCHYTAHWLERNYLGSDSGYYPSVLKMSEKFLTRDEAETIVHQKLEELRNCELAKSEWFKELYLTDIEYKFFVERCEEIY